MQTKGNIIKISEKEVEFDDGFIFKNVDLIIYGTGYKQDFKFLEDKDSIFVKSKIDDKGQYFAFISEKPGLYFVGNLYPSGSHWKVFQTQAKLAAECIAKNINHSKLKEIFRNEDSILHYSIYNNGDNYTNYININRYLNKAKFYYKILCKIR